MANPTKAALLGEVEKRYGNIHKLGNSQSLYDIGDGAGRIYIRYSKVHGRGQAFYGLREQDLRKLGGHLSIICFIWPDQAEPLFVPYSDFEDVFHSTSPAGDGQYKVQVFLQESGCDLYIANAGRFNAEAYFGWIHLDNIISKSRLEDQALLSHVQVQSLLGGIGAAKGFDIWIPRSDQSKLDWSITKHFAIARNIPPKYKSVEHILAEVDVLWIERGAGRLRALFEVEHSTPVYSGLLRFNDVHLTSPNLKTTYSIVSNDDRRALFVKQISRPTFVLSRLNECCTFIEYLNVLAWHKRILI